MKIAFFLPDLRVGGAERATLTVAGALQERGFDVELVLGNELGELSNAVPAGVQLVDLNCVNARTSKIIFGIQILFKLSYYIKSVKPAIFFSTIVGANIVSIFAKIIFRFKDTKFVVRDSCSQAQVASIFKKLVLRKLYPLADAHIAISKTIKRDLTNYFNVDEATIYKISNPVDVKRVLTLSKMDIGFRCPLDTNVPLVVSVGRLCAEKAFDYLIKEFHKVVNQVDARLVIVGEGEGRGQLEKLIVGLGIQSKVHLIGAAENPYPYFSAADLFVLSSRSEGFPNVLLEALCLEVPIVSTNCVSGPAEILDNGKFGKLVTCDEPGSLANAMLEELTQKLDKTSGYIERALLYSVDAIAEKYLLLIHALTIDKVQLGPSISV